jgi:hypothetical protein
LRGNASALTELTVANVNTCWVGLGWPWIENDRRIRELLTRLGGLGIGHLEADQRRTEDQTSAWSIHG